MRTSRLLFRNLAWYWRTNLAVVLGVATAVAVLGGALLVGKSVRASLRDLALGRLGNAECVITRNAFFDESLAAAFHPACPLIVLDGVLTDETTNTEAAQVAVYGADARFWNFQHTAGAPPSNSEALLTSVLLVEIGAKPGDALRIRVQKPSAIPTEWLHGRKDDLGKTIRLTLRAGAAPDFSLRLQQGDVRAVFVPLDRLARELQLNGKVNTILTADPRSAQELIASCNLADMGVRMRRLEAQHATSLETDSALLNDSLAQAAQTAADSLNLHADPILTYVVNSIRANGRSIPYSLVTGSESLSRGIALNEWAARDLNVHVGDRATLEYYVWQSDGRLETKTADFNVSELLPMNTPGLDRDLAPDYPGITESASLRDWDPPFPIDLRRIRPVDEQYWREYRTTPKALIPLGHAREMWGSRFGSLTSIRISPESPAYADALRRALDPERMGFALLNVKAQALAAARGSTDFGEYFLYFSFFLVLSALLLTGLFFRLGIEQRLREIGLLRALGFSMSKLRALFLSEGVILATAGAIVGVLLALAYGALIVLGLRSVWIGAVGARSLSLHASALALAIGAVAGVVTSLAVIAWSLWRLQPVNPRGLLAGHAGSRPTRRPWIVGAIFVLMAAAVLAVALLSAFDQTAAFFTIGALLLAGGISFQFGWLGSRDSRHARGLWTLGARTAARRAGRTVLCSAMIASATFLIVAVDAFRQAGPSQGDGGFSFVAESVVPIVHNPNEPAGRDALNIPAVSSLDIVPFRLRAGDDASCLNLYQPRNPRVLGAPERFIRTATFPFEQAIAPTPNPWLLLDSSAAGAIPAIADTNSMTYILHKKLGEEFLVNGVRFRIVATLRDSIFQSELIISEQNFLRAFPNVEGFRFFLLHAPPTEARTDAQALEASLSDFGFHSESTSARLGRFRQVENTYISTFRSLGALGLVLGVVGLAAILLRNVLEQRRELALLRAVGYRTTHLATVVLSETALLLLSGLAMGTVCALIAIAPVIQARGGRLPLESLASLLGVVALTGAAASLIATRIALRSPLLPALRSE